MSTLLDWCRANSVEVLAVQPPGRGARREEAFVADLQARVVSRFGFRFFNARSLPCPPQTLAARLLPQVGRSLLEAPYCVVGHSVGTWAAFEFLALARDHGLPMPRHAFLSSFPPPTIPVNERPWTARDAWTQARSAAIIVRSPQEP